MSVAPVARANGKRLARCPACGSPLVARATGSRAGFLVGCSSCGWSQTATVKGTAWAETARGAPPRTADGAPARPGQITGMLKVRTRTSARVATNGGPEMAAVRCFRCGRSGRILARLLLSRRPRDIICPKCKGLPMPATPTSDRGGPSLGGGALPNVGLPPFRPPVLVGRPPLILTRSRTPPAPESTEPPVSAANGGSMFEVRCFTCGRTGRLPVRPGVSLRPEDIICPSCRAKRPRSAIPRSLRSGYLRPPLPGSEPTVSY